MARENHQCWWERQEEEKEENYNHHQNDCFLLFVAMLRVNRLSLSLSLSFLFLVLISCWICVCQRNLKETREQRKRKIEQEKKRFSSMENERRRREKLGFSFSLSLLRLLLQRLRRLLSRARWMKTWMNERTNGESAARCNRVFSIDWENVQTIHLISSRPFLRARRKCRSDWSKRYLSTVSTLSASGKKGESHVVIGLICERGGGLSHPMRNSRLVQIDLAHALHALRSLWLMLFSVHVTIEWDAHIRSSHFKMSLPPVVHQNKRHRSSLLSGYLSEMFWKDFRFSAFDGNCDHLPICSASLICGGINQMKIF